MGYTVNHDEPVLPSNLTVDVRNHIDKTLALLPDSSHEAVLLEYLALFNGKSEQQANLFMLHLQINQVMVQRIPYCFLPAFLRVFAEFFKQGKTTKKLKKKMELITRIRGFWAIALDDLEAKAKAEEMAGRCKRMLARKDLESTLFYVATRGILDVSGDEQAQALRVSSPSWWLGQLNTIRTQGVEALAQLLGLVDTYLSKYSKKQQQKKHESSILMLANNVAVSPDGAEVCLLDIAMSAIRGRFSRLLNWADGMGDYAEKYGHECAMFTLTCPSKMHPYSAKYDGTTIREAQQYLADLWNLANARFKKRGIYPYGFRVAEPHKKDGAVHWHILIFAPREVLEEIDNILLDHALRVDGFELGADEHRYKFEFINKRTGGAKPSSYLFKYLMKGLGGKENYTADDVHKILEESLTGVKAWAKTHGIRQIQMVGGVSVGVWNELRSIEKELEDSHLEKMRLACQDGDFCTFFELQGGHTKGKTKHYAKVSRRAVITGTRESIDTTTGEIIQDQVVVAMNDYGEVIEEVTGLESTEKPDSENYWHITNRKTKWSIDWKTTHTKQSTAVDGVKAWELEPDISEAIRFNYVDPDMVLDVLTLGA